MKIAILLLVICLTLLLWKGRKEKEKAKGKGKEREKETPIVERYQSSLEVMKKVEKVENQLRLEVVKRGLKGVIQGREKEKERERAAMKRNQGLEAMKKLGKGEMKNQNVQWVHSLAFVVILLEKEKEKETNLQRENHLKGGLKGAKEKGREKDRVIMKNQKFAVVKNRCQNQGVIALMKRDLAQSALQDLLWKKSLCQHGRLVKTNVRAT